MKKLIRKWLGIEDMQAEVSKGFDHVSDAIQLLRFEVEEAAEVTDLAIAKIEEFINFEPIGIDEEIDKLALGGEYLACIRGANESEIESVETTLESREQIVCPNICNV